MIRQRLLSSFALTLLLLVPALAQIPEDQSQLDQKEKQRKALEMKKELERKTFAMLDELIGSAAALKLPENRALVLSSAADLLWTRDEKRARALFKEALNILNSTASNPDAKMSDEQHRAFQMFVQQRQEIIRMIARRDIDMALELLRTSHSPIAPTTMAGKQLLNEKMRFEESLAAQVAANDPKRAFQMAEDSLSKGLSLGLLNLLAHINDKDTELAGRFATNIVSKLRSESLTTNSESLWVAVMLLRMGIQPEDDGSGTYLSFGSMGGGKTPFKLDERQIRDLLEVVTSAALSGMPHPSLFSLMPSLMPEIEKRIPERAPLLRRRIAESVRTLGPEERMFVQYQELTHHGTIEALLEAAAKAPDKARNMLYERAVWKAVTKGDTERARQIVNDNIRDTSARDRILESLDRMSIWEALRKEKLNEVRQKLARIKSKEERAGILAQLALNAAIKKDRKLALELLNETLPLISFKPKSDTQLYILLQVGRVYALVEPVRAFEMIESLVDQANDLLSAASVLNGFFLPSGVFRKGEMVLPPGYSNITMRFRQFGKELAALALLNFEQTKAAADKFQRNEARIMARLFIVQGVLSEQLGSDVSVYQGHIALNY